MSLKQLINALFKLSGSQAMPKSDDSLVVAYSTTNQAYTAPYDGYLCVVGNSNSDSSEIVLTQNEISTGTTAAQNGWGVRQMMPLAKGQTANINFIGISTATIYFCRLIGGGINRLLSQAVRCVRGGGLCLNSSNTFVLSLIQQLPDLARVIRLTPYLFLLKAHQVFQLSLQLMVGVVYTLQGNSTEFTYRRIISSEVFLQLHGMLEMATTTLQDVSRFAKEKQLLASLEELRNLLVTSCTLQNDRCLNNAKEVCHA